MEVVAQKVFTKTGLHHDNRTDISDIRFPTVPAARDAELKMMALEFRGTESVAVKEVPRVKVTDPTDAVIRVTGSTICGSDLHLYHKEFQGLESGDILGHEAIGVVDAVGPGVKRFHVGQRVAISAIIACGECDYCKREQFSCCDRTNPDPLGAMNKLYGHRIAGVFGYSRMLGGFEGCQASMVRVPCADVNLLPLSERVSDENAILLTDIACTAWHANELAEVKEGDTVCVWGCGPVGLLCAFWAKHRGAKTVVSIDSVPYRLAAAKDMARADAVINYREQDVVKTIQAMLPGGPNKCIDATGFRFAQSLAHRAMRALGTETDTPEVLNEMITVCQKSGYLCLIAEYSGYANHVNIGALMEKSLTLRGGVVFCQKYWKKIHDWMADGTVDLSWMITHRMPLSEAARGYSMFDRHEDNVLKILLRP